MSREEAVEQLKEPLYDSDQLIEDKLYFTKKLGISLHEFESIMNQKIVKFSEFKNQVEMEKRIKKALRFLINPRR